MEGERRKISLLDSPFSNQTDAPANVPCQLMSVAKQIVAGTWQNCFRSANVTHSVSTVGEVFDAKYMACLMPKSIIIYYTGTSKKSTVTIINGLLFRTLDDEMRTHLKLLAP
jgi:hypothetical protein